MTPDAGTGRSTVPPLRELRAESLGCRRGGRWLFRGVTLTLRPRAVVWLRGTNGSGKTSLLRLLSGLAEPDEGTLRLAPQATPEGAAPSSEAVNERVARAASLLSIGHQNALKDDLTLHEALTFLAELHAQPSAPSAVTAALDALDVAALAEVPVRRLSQGQRRRGALARLALDARPRHWLLDEPFDALDGAAIGRLRALLAAHAARGGSVLLTSHQPVDLPGLSTFDLAAPTLHAAGDAAVATS